MPSDLIQGFVRQLAAQVAAGVLSGAWAEVRAWFTRRGHAANLKVLTQFEENPAAHTEALAQLLSLLQFAEDQQGHAIIAGATTSVSQTASGGVVVQAGGNIGTVQLTAPATASVAPAETLTQQQEALLAALDELQVRFAAAKLIVGRNGDVYQHAGTSAQPTGVNLAVQLFGQTPPPSGGTHQAFEALIESAPTHYLRSFPETRLDSPFVVAVTPEGRAYLQRSRTGGGGAR